MFVSRYSISDTIRAGQVGTDIRADAVERVALLACFAKYRPAQVRIGRRLRSSCAASSRYVEIRAALSAAVLRTWPQMLPSISSIFSLCRLWSWRIRSADRSVLGTCFCETAAQQLEPVRRTRSQTSRGPTVFRLATALDRRPGSWPAYEDRRTVPGRTSAASRNAGSAKQRPEESLTSFGIFGGQQRFQRSCAARCIGPLRANELTHRLRVPRSRQMSPPASVASLRMSSGALRVSLADRRSAHSAGGLTCRCPASELLMAPLSIVSCSSASLDFPSARTSTGSPALPCKLPMRRSMNSRTSGNRLCRSYKPKARARSGSATAIGSAAYQYMRARFWSFASSACRAKSFKHAPTSRRPAARCIAEARYSRTTDDGSCRRHRGELRQQTSQLRFARDRATVAPPTPGRIRSGLSSSFDTTRPASRR